MRISDLSHQIPTAIALAERMGVQTRQSLRRRRVERVGYFGVGLALGSGLAGLRAPRSGVGTRRRRREGVQEARDYGTGDEAEPARARHDAA